MSRGPHRPRSGIDPVLRSRARRRALQAIYAWQISGGNSQQLIASGETPVQVILSMKAHHMISQGVQFQLAIPKAVARPR